MLFAANLLSLVVLSQCCFTFAAASQSVAHGGQSKLEEIVPAGKLSESTATSKCATSGEGCAKSQYGRKTRSPPPPPPPPRVDPDPVQPVPPVPPLFTPSVAASASAGEKALHIAHSPRDVASDIELDLDLDPGRGFTPLGPLRTKEEGGEFAGREWDEALLAVNVTTHRRGRSLQACCSGCCGFLCLGCCCCPSNCQGYHAAGACSKSCGGGTKTMTWHQTQGASCGGSCSQSTYTTNCNTHACPPPPPQPSPPPPPPSPPPYWVGSPCECMGQMGFSVPSA